MPDDREIIQHIDQLVDEEHALERAHGEGKSLNGDERARLKALEVQLDQLWDLLRRRRAAKQSGVSPDEVESRPVEEVEHYLQ